MFIKKIFSLRNIIIASTFTSFFSLLLMAIDFYNADMKRVDFNDNKINITNANINKKYTIVNNNEEKTIGSINKEVYLLRTKIKAVLLVSEQIRNEINKTGSLNKLSIDKAILILEKEIDNNKIRNIDKKSIRHYHGSSNHSHIPPSQGINHRHSGLNKKIGILE